MGAWTAQERLTLIAMLGDQLRAKTTPNLYNYGFYVERTQHLAGSTNEFLEQHRGFFAAVIERYNREKPDEDAAI